MKKDWMAIKKLGKLKPWLAITPPIDKANINYERSSLYPFYIKIYKFLSRQPSTLAVTIIQLNKRSYVKFGGSL